MIPHPAPPRATSEPRPPRWRRPWLLVLVWNALYLGAVFAANGGDADTFVTLGSCYARCEGARSLDDPACPPGSSEGYDGQFAYYLARDPANAPDCLDAPAYRAQRILLPLLGRALSLGRADLIPWAFVTVNLAALVIGTALLEDLLAGVGGSRWYALSYGLFAGVFMAVRLSTPEPLAYGLVIAALWTAEREHLNRAALLFALAALAKEPALLFAAGLALHLLLTRRATAALRLALIVGVPFVAWQLALIAWLGAPGIGSGGAGSTPFTPIPFGGVWRIMTEEGLAGLLVQGVVVFPFAVLPGMWGLWRAGHDLRAGQRDVVTCLLLVNAAVMLFLPYSTYREFLGVLRFLPGLVLSVLLYSARHAPGRPLRYTTLWIPLLLFVVAG